MKEAHRISGEVMMYLPYAPDIPGLAFRAFQGEADFEHMAAVHEGSAEWDQIDPLSAREGVPSAAELARTFHELKPGSRDMLLVETDGQVVGFNHVLWRWTEANGEWVYLHLGYLLPAWRGRGIGRAMLRWAQERIREIAAGDPTEGNAVFATNASSTEREATALIHNAGYPAIRRISDMVLHDLAALPRVELPTGLVLRPVQAEDYWPIYTALKDAWHGLPMSTPESEADYQSFLDKMIHVPEFDPTLWQIAWDGDQVAGLVLCAIENGVGTIPDVAVRKAWQRRGVARALMIHGLEALRARGVPQVRLITDAADSQGARSLYESLGFREVKQHVFYRKPIYAEM